MSSTTTQRLAIDGGAPLRTRPFPTINDARGRQIGAEELALLTEVIRSGQLNRKKPSARSPRTTRADGPG